MGRMDGGKVTVVASDEARYITGVALPVYAGSCLK
jgi:hypothetical protein